MTTGETWTFERLTEADWSRLWEWLNRPHVAARWGGPITLDRVRAKYRPRLGVGSPVTPYFARLDGVPVGFIQSYWATQVGDEWPEERDPGVVGIDQFLADDQRLDRGLGTEMVRQFVTRLFEDRRVTRIQTDPSPDNDRAIRCYETAGFRRHGLVAKRDGPALLMGVDRNSDVVRGD
jgi:RimJ/RimL family protein N-acetyltransferase